MGAHGWIVIDILSLTSRLAPPCWHWTNLWVDRRSAQGDGIMVSDGIMISDGIMLGDASLQAQSFLISGDPTAAMTVIKETTVK